MKKLVLVLVLFVFLISCGGDDGGDGELKSSDIQGIWKYTENFSFSGTCSSDDTTDNEGDDIIYLYFKAVGSDSMEVYQCAEYDENYGEYGDYDPTCFTKTLDGIFQLENNYEKKLLYLENEEGCEEDDILEGLTCKMCTIAKVYIEFENKSQATYNLDFTYVADGYECDNLDVSDVLEEEYGMSGISCYKKAKSIMIKEN